MAKLLNRSWQEEGVIGEMRIFSGDTAPENWLLCDGSKVDLSVYYKLYAVPGIKKWTPEYMDDEAIITGDLRRDGSGVVYEATSTGTTSGVTLDVDVGVTWVVATEFYLPNMSGVSAKGIGDAIFRDTVTNGGNRTKTGHADVGTYLEDQMQRITGELPESLNNGIPDRNQYAYTNRTGVFTPSVTRNTGLSVSTGSTPGIGIGFSSTDSPNARTSSTTDGETRDCSAGVLYIIKYK